MVEAYIWTYLDNVYDKDMRLTGRFHLQVAPVNHISIPEGR